MNKKISINQFGAIANSGKDATPALREAIAECKKSGANRLVFAKGKYDFYPATGPNNAIAGLDGINDLVVDGAGSEMMLHGICNFIYVWKCERVTIKNMVVDYEEMTHSMATITAVTPTYFDAQVHPEYPVARQTKVTAVMEYDPATKRPVKHGADEYYQVSELQHTGPQQVRCLLKTPTIMKAGNWVMLRHHVYDAVVIGSHDNKNLCIDNITVYNSPGMAFTVGKCHTGQFTRLIVKPRPGASQYQSAGADGIHFGGCSGDILLDRCHFEAMGDDGVNLKTGLYLTVKEVVDSKTVLAQHNLKMLDTPDVGDTVELMDQEDLITYASTKVAKVEVLEDNMVKVSFEHIIPTQLAVNHLIGNISRCCNATIRRVKVLNNRARGMLIQNRHTLVEDCEFAHCTMGGVWIFNEVTYFFESIAPHYVTVRNCKFNNVGIYHPSDCVLGTYAMMPRWESPKKPGVFQHIVIENNVIDGCDNCGILVTGTTDGEVKNNTIRNACIMPTVPRGAYAFEVEACSDVKITGNTSVKSQQSEKCQASFHLGAYQKEKLDIRDNNGF
ncbi:MAG: right-handed parallel beta-helix repeat-containing protein [Armatimonadota bacterium]